MGNKKEAAIIDVRFIHSIFRHALIFKTFEDLTPGQFFLLINDHDPASLHQKFVVKHPDLFAWEYVQQGPEIWKVHIKKILTRTAA